MPGPLDNPAVQHVHALAGKHLTPTLKRQAAFVAATYSVVPVAGAVRGIAKPARLYSTYKHAAGLTATLFQIASVLPALGPNFKLGLRFGTEAETKPLMGISPFLAGYFPEYMYYTPIPVPEFGLTAVPNDSSRWIYETNKSSIQSTGGQDTSRTRKPEARTTTRGPSAPPKDRSRPSSKKPVRRIPRADRRGPATWWGRRHRTPEEEILEKYYTRRR